MTREAPDAAASDIEPVGPMRQLMTIRIDPDVLSAARGRATDENRTLTNYIETVLRRDLGLMGIVTGRQRPNIKRTRPKRGDRN